MGVHRKNKSFKLAVVNMRLKIKKDKFRAFTFCIMVLQELGFIGFLENK